MQQAARWATLRDGMGLLLPTVAPVLSAAILIHASVTLSASRRWELHTHEVLQSISAATQTLDEAVLRQQNFILTGDRGALALLYVSFERLHVALNAVERLTADNPSQQATIAEGRPVIDAALRLVAQGVARRHAGEVGWEEASSLGASLDAGVGQVKLVFGHLADEERVLLVSRAEASREAELYLALGACVSGLLALASFALAIARIRQRDEAAGPAPAPGPAGPRSP